MINRRNAVTSSASGRQVKKNKSFEYLMCIFNIFKIKAGSGICNLSLMDCVLYQITLLDLGEREHEHVTCFFPVSKRLWFNYSALLIGSLGISNFPASPSIFSLIEEQKTDYLRFSILIKCLWLFFNYMQVGSCSTVDYVLFLEDMDRYETEHYFKWFGLLKQTTRLLTIHW